MIEKTNFMYSIRITIHCAEEFNAIMYYTVYEEHRTEEKIMN